MEFPAFIPPALAKFIKFCIVGSIGVLVDFGLTYLLKEKLKLNKYIASTFGFFVAASGNYLLNRSWTFNNHSADIGAQYSKFIIVSTIGVVISNAIVWMFHERFKINFYLAKGLAIAIVLIWNFLANAFFTFQ
jgi:putative flippase GtrA